MFADIASGKTDAADVVFLIAAVLAVVAAFCFGSRRADVVVWAPVLGWLGVACVALALMLL
jgi:hypothetical protein